LSRPYDPRIAQVAEFVRSNPAQRVSLETAAAIAGLSPAHFQSLFKRYMGQTYRSFCVQVRLQYAQTWLAESTLGIEEIFLFSRQFKKHFQMSPSEWRQQRLRSHLLEARLVFEEGVAELACIHATDEDIDSLNTLIKEMSNVSSLHDSFAWDHKFHKRLVAATHNPAMEGMQGFIDAFFTTYAANVSQATLNYIAAVHWQDYVQTVLIQGHKVIVDAVAGSDVQLARRVMRNHITAGQQHLYKP
jgi:AraC-like DNA-binding protein